MIAERALNIARLARLFGWTMEQVRSHSLRDVRAMQLVLSEEEAARKLAQARSRRR